MPNSANFSRDHIVKMPPGIETPDGINPWLGTKRPKALRVDNKAVVSGPSNEKGQKIFRVFLDLTSSIIPLRKQEILQVNAELPEP